MIIVTGASKGLGQAICQRLINQNFEVLGLARSIDDIQFKAMRCDVSNFEDIKAVARQLKAEGVKVSGLINAAGIASMNMAVTTPPATVQNIIQTNLVGTIYACQQFAPLMIRQKYGRIINFSTIAVPLAMKGESIYAASKAGVEAFTRAFAREVSGFNINVHCISPGPINTDLLKGVRTDQIQALVDHQIINRQFLPGDVCDLVELLLDHRSSSLSGQVFHIGGA